MKMTTKKKKKKPKAVPWLLMKFQRRWMEDDARVRVCVKSRRIGMSWTAACEAVLTASSTVGGRSQYYVGYDAKMALNFIQDAVFWCKRYGLVAGKFREALFHDSDDDGGSRDILAYTLRFASGHTITALSSTPRNLRAKGGDAIIDEAAWHDDLPGLMKAANAFLMWGGRVSIVSTLNGIDNDFYRLILEIRAGRKDYSLHETNIDDALADGLHKRICIDNGLKWSKEAQAAWRAKLFQDYGDDAQEELLCVPANSGGIYIPRGLIESRMEAGLPVIQLEHDDAFAQLSDQRRAVDTEQWCREHLWPLLVALPSDRQHYFGMDFGRSADLTVIAPITLLKDMRRKVPFLIELRNVPFLEQEIIAKHVLKALPRLSKFAVDSTGNGQYLGERLKQKYGPVTAQPIMMSERWYAENLPKLKAAFEDGRIIIPRDADVASDLASFRVVNGVPKLPKLKLVDSRGNGRTRHGDSAIAIALAYYASGETVAKPGAHTTLDRSVRGRIRDQQFRDRAISFRDRKGAL